MVGTYCFGRGQIYVLKLFVNVIILSKRTETATAFFFIILKVCSADMQYKEYYHSRHKIFA